MLSDKDAWKERLASDSSLARSVHGHVRQSTRRPERNALKSLWIILMEQAWWAFRARFVLHGDGHGLH